MKLCLLALLSTSLIAQIPQTEAARWQQHAANVTITRDDWGIAHVHGKSDADAVFGMEYAQAEDDFHRIETNYLAYLGRTAEAEGEAKIWQDLRARMFINAADLKREYTESPAWLKQLMDAFADGLNFYLAKHPEVKPMVITHFEPWMALSFTEGSISGDIERVSLDQLAKFYGDRQGDARASLEPQEREPSGSNGMAIAPANTLNHHALLLINPHTTFFFRSELQVTSDEGLNAYGAATWGQFFIYQGFNERAGWMHTTSGVDAVDEYSETISKRGSGYVYKYGNEERPVTTKQIVVPYKTASGTQQKTVTVFYTLHGPVIREDNGKWISFRMMQKPIEQLEQSFLRTKAHAYAEYKKTMELYANSSNNTIFADADGDIAYFHGNFIPRRDPHFDYTKLVDGSTPATEWHESLTVEQSPHLLNPKSGWLYNANNWPWTAAGESSPKRQDYPAYVEQGTESARGLHAIRVLHDRHDFDLDRLISAAYDSYLPWFDKPLPTLIRAWDTLPASDPMKQHLAPQVELLRHWDQRWSASSVPTTLAIFWGEELRRRDLGPKFTKEDFEPEDYTGDQATNRMMLEALAASSDKLDQDFGTWQTAWGDVNRFQRVTPDIQQPFNDQKPSIPVAFTSSVWGSLASFGARSYPGTKRWYGTAGNSFVAVVEFGPHVRAKAVTAGGESGHLESLHFKDQQSRYAEGNLRDVYFYPEQLKGHIERTYRPGE